jgi:hypothetical protein
VEFGWFLGRWENFEVALPSQKRKKQVSSVKMGSEGK